MSESWSRTPQFGRGFSVVVEDVAVVVVVVVVDGTAVEVVVVVVGVSVVVKGVMDTVVVEGFLVVRFFP